MKEKFLPCTPFSKNLQTGVVLNLSSSLFNLHLNKRGVDNYNIKISPFSKFFEDGGMGEGSFLLRKYLPPYILSTILLQRLFHQCRNKVIF